jgi:hypothetical protein
MTERGGYPDNPPPDSGRPGPSYGLDLLRAVAIGALLVIAAGLVLDAAPSLTGDQRLVLAGFAALLAALLGLSAGVYQRRS